MDVPVMSSRDPRQTFPRDVNARSGDWKPHSEHTTRAILLGLLAGALWIIWQAVRSTLLAFLVILEPIVGILLSALALLLTLTAFLWKFASDRPDFPFFLVLGSALACFLALALYRGLIQLLSARR
jgi:hypothetical protein